MRTLFQPIWISPFPSGSIIFVGDLNNAKELEGGAHLVLSCHLYVFVSPEASVNIPGPG